MATILCVEDEAAALLVLRTALERGGHRAICTSNVDAALTALSRGGIDIIVSDYLMPDATGIDLLQRLGEYGYETPLIMVTGHASIEHAVEAIKAGAIEYITKPLRPEQLLLAVDQALTFARLRDENATLRAELSRLRANQQIVGESPALKRVLDMIATIAPTRSAVLLQGESGTGKELIARALHELSDRRDRQFIGINCAALPETLVESTLFGHELGAFTGAVKQVRGAFERADRGTLLLDEISEMRLEVQAKLLRVLQEREFERVGGSASIKVDVRIIATTNRDLEAEVRRGTFREDLFYRLNVMPIRVPPLRDRMEDVPLLAHRFAQRTARDIGKTITGISPEALQLLQTHAWPGNVRELAHAVERAVILSGGPVLRPQAFDALRSRLRPLPDASSSAACQTPDAGAADPMSAGRAPAARVVLSSFRIADAERTLIEHALAATGANRTRAAELLGISPRTLRSKLNSPDA